MKRINKFIKILVLCLVLIMPMLFSACKKNNDKGENRYYLYYQNKNQTKLVTVNHYTDETDTGRLVEELLKAMNETSNKINKVTAIPSNVSIVKWKVEDKILFIDFDSSYMEMNKISEILCRSAVVLTLTQIPGIDYVYFSVKDEALTDVSGKVIGNMKALDFIDNSGSTINSYEKRTSVIYYADEKGEKLLPREVSTVYSTNTSMEKFIIEQLQKGSGGEDVKRTIPPEVKLNSISTKDGICYVNFDAEFLNANLEISAEAEIYSIVNSLCELSYVNKVQISINGDTNKNFRDKISLKDYFVRNLDVVETQESE